jgi:hypothetical protein
MNAQEWAFMSPINLLVNKADELLGTLVEPVWRRILALSWFSRLAILLIMVGLILAVTYREQAAASAETLTNFAKVLWAKDSQIPLSTSLISKVRETATRIAISLEGDVNRPGETDSPAWPIAQATAASHRLIAIDLERLAKFFRDTAEPSCRCWKEIPDPSHPRNIPVTAWVIFTLAEVNIPATSEEITFLVKEQHSEGWWSIFPVDTGNPEHASSYATAWAVLALHNQLSKKLISGGDALRASDAASTGASWLITKRGPTARWKDYPQDPTGKISESISGLVLYALHAASPSAVRGIDDDWLENLPSVPSSSESESDYHWINGKDGRHLDALVQIKLPWMLIATASAYQSGGTLQRARALGWLKSALQQQSVLTADTQPENWWRAELLYGLTYVLALTPNFSEETRSSPPEDSAQ